MSFIFNGVTLPSPDWGNTQALRAKQHVHRSLSGKYFTFVSKPYHQTQYVETLYNLKYTFSNISYNKYLELRASLESVTGQINITDHESVVWIVSLLSTTTSVVFESQGEACTGHTTRFLNERGTITLELEGWQF